MIKREIIEKHLEDMATYVAHLHRYQRLSFEEFANEGDNLASVHNPVHIELDSFRSLTFPANLSGGRLCANWGQTSIY